MRITIHDEHIHVIMSHGLQGDEILISFVETSNKSDRRLLMSCVLKN